MSMRTEPKFVTPMDFYNYHGIDLNAMLKVNNNVSNKANIFLMQIESRIMSWIDSHTFRNIRWEELEGDRLENFQKAILTQAMYVYRNSDIAMDSGYDPEKGIIAAREELEKIEISRATIDFLVAAGLFNLNIENRFRRITSLY
jgi:hypothetical protein